MTNILITGATGYVGSNLISYLSEQGFNIIFLARNSSNSQKVNELKKLAKCYIVDGYSSIKKVFTENKIDVVIHLAATPKYNYKAEEIEEMIESNFSFGVTILEAMSENGCNKIINFGTYWQKNENGRPNCLYAALKQSFEDILKIYSQDKKIDFLSLRITDIYGENDPRPKLFNQLKNYDKNLSLAMTAGQQEINLIYIKDVLLAVKQAIDLIFNKSHNNIYYVCGNETFTLKKIVEIYQKETGNNTKINWGALPYNKNQIMKLDLGEKLPGFKAKYNIIDVVKKL